MSRIIKLCILITVMSTVTFILIKGIENHFESSPTAQPTELIQIKS